MHQSDQMPSLLKLRSKLRRPPLATEVIARPRHDELLQQPLGGKLLLLQAPAGYGKSTLINQWSRQQDLATLWYNLDHTDSSPQSFIHYLDLGLRQLLQLPEPASTLTKNVNAELTPEARLIALLNELPDEYPPLLLVLDDYHLIDSETDHQLLRFLCRHQPDYLTLAVLTRTPPPLGIPELRAKGRLVELHSDELAFDADETAELLSSHLNFEASREQAERLNRRTEGWASALKLATLTGQTPALLDEFIDQLSLGHPHIVDYLADEVIGPLAEPLKQFLYRTCILQQFNLELAQRVSGQQDAAARLAELTGQGLFISRQPQDGDSRWYRYHGLFANCLQQLLAQHHPDQQRQLHQRASDAWLALENPAKAADHALKAQDEQLLTAILLRYGRQLFRDGQLLALEQCLNQLSEDSICRQPLLTLLRAWVAQSQYQFEQAEQWLAKAEQTLKPIYNDEEWRTLQGDFNAVRAQIAMNIGQTEQAISYAELALELQPEHMRTSRTTALSVLGEAAFVQGRLDDAYQRMQQTEQLARSHDASKLVLWTLSQQSEISMARGYLQQAYNLQEKALNYAEENRLPPSPLMEFIHRVRGQILWEWHNLEAVEKCALKGIETLEGHGERWNLQCYTLLAKVALGQGKQQLCADYIKRMQKLLASWDYHIDWIANAHATLVTYWEEVRDLDSLHHWLDGAPVVRPATNHFAQCSVRNRARALTALKHYDEADQLLRSNLDQAEQCGLVLDQTRNLIYLAQLRWQQEQREEALDQLHRALTLASTSGVLSSFLRLGKPLIVMLKALLNERQLADLEQQRAERLINLSQQRRNFSKAIRITLDEAIIQDIINRPDVPELIRTSPLTRREWQVLSLIQAGLPNEQIASQLNVAPTTIKTHIRSLYQKLGVANRNEAIALASDLLAKIQGE
ncbi:HTH-type transcriptional regulator MalT [Marinobacterium arenosum]|uniref:HTH-type transcriptional regulator MalT n=1 Tax=Marinobacterium arenosum TaxID=2862496 RepID=UPI001C96BA48|nr:HTH-type transcriptional regulator MalT [Marinobacterium arenosum]MBY4677233.1 HTH-type transcriptional regulator MalT [Marinobacterium arenosum]